MKHSTNLGKLYDAPPADFDDEDDERKVREQDIVKSSWLRESPALLANRIPTSVFALGDLAVLHG